MAQYLENESGTLVKGHFFQLYAETSENRHVAENDEWIVSTHIDEVGAMWARLSDHETISSFDCKKAKSHVTGKRYKNIEFDLFGSNVLPVVRDSNGFTFIVSEGLRNDLVRSKLAGTEFIKVTVNVMQPEGKSPPLYVPTFPGRNAKRPHAVYPNEGNKCPFCGVSPVYCRECGAEEFSKCPKCGEFPMVLFKSKKKGDTRILIMPAARGGHVVDGSKWDGADFFGGVQQFVTRRAVDFLLSIHAGPFKARPLRTFIDECTNEQIMKLDEAKRPVK